MCLEANCEALEYVNVIDTARSPSSLAYLRCSLMTLLSFFRAVLIRFRDDVALVSILLTSSVMRATGAGVVLCCELLVAVDTEDKGTPRVCVPHQLTSCALDAAYRKICPPHADCGSVDGVFWPCGC